MFEVDRAFRVALLLLTAGCANEEDAVNTAADSGVPEQRASSVVFRWVGAVEETDVRVAAIVGAGKAHLFFCGGADSYPTATHWFDIAFNSEHLEYKDDAWRIHAHLMGGGLLGEVERAGDGVRMFNARASERATIAGLYEGKADCGHLGVIVTQAAKDDPPTAQGACVGAAGEAQQVNAITPIALQDGKLMVRTASSGDKVLPLTAATLEPL